MKKKSVLCVIASKGLMDHIYPFYLAYVFLCMNEMSSLINHVRLGTVIAYICGNVLRRDEGLDLMKFSVYLLI